MESDADTISSDENSENSEIDKFDAVKDISEKAKGQEISEGSSIFKKQIHNFCPSIKNWLDRKKRSIYYVK